MDIEDLHLDPDTLLHSLTRERKKILGIANLPTKVLIETYHMKAILRGKYPPLLTKDQLQNLIDNIKSINEKTQ